MLLLNTPAPRPIPHHDRPIDEKELCKRRRGESKQEARRRARKVLSDADSLFSGSKIEHGPLRTAVLEYVRFVKRKRKKMKKDHEKQAREEMEIVLQRWVAWRGWVDLLYFSPPRARARVLSKSESPPPFYVSPHLQARGPHPRVGWISLLYRSEDQEI